MKKKFAIIGAAGYIAPRHLRAIKETGGHLIAALDPHDSVGILDSYAPECAFFTETERFDRFLSKRGDLDYLVVCSPNYLHDAHCRLGLRLGADVICEKPLAINPWNLDELQEEEEQYGRRIYAILQLRSHRAIRDLYNRMRERENLPKEIILRYITSRGPWYHYSWKGNPGLSGGLLHNIGIHFIDMLLWIWGKPYVMAMCEERNGRTITGGFQFPHGIVCQWELSVDGRKLPPGHGPTFRELLLDGEPFNFTDGFTDLHTEVYRDILDGRGWGIDDARPAIQAIRALRDTP